MSTLRRSLFLLVPLAALLLGGLLALRLRTANKPAPPAVAPPPAIPEAAPAGRQPAPVTPIPEAKMLAAWKDDFQAGSLDPVKWVAVSAGDFNERTIDVVDTAKTGPNDFRLRLRADTLGTDDKTVKFLGVRSVARIDLSAAARVAAGLDWNDQANGCYLSAALILSPELTAENPLSGNAWLKVEYIGVPPGQNGRLAVVVKDKGLEKFLFTEGWPETNRAGRKLGLQKLVLVLRGGALEVWENEKLLYASKTPVISFGSAWLYLQMSSHSNYRARELFFDNVEVSTGTDVNPGR